MSRAFSRKTGSRFFAARSRTFRPLRTRCSATRPRPSSLRRTRDSPRRGQIPDSYLRSQETCLIFTVSGATIALGRSTQRRRECALADLLARLGSGNARAQQSALHGRDGGLFSLGRISPQRLATPRRFARAARRAGGGLAGAAKAPRRHDTLSPLSRPGLRRRRAHIGQMLLMAKQGGKQHAGGH
jgi:hypothetical protein